MGVGLRMAMPCLLILEVCFPCFLGGVWTADEKVVLCGNCVGCSSGRGHVCRTFGYVGGSTPFGGYSDKILVSEDMLHKLPASVPLDFAAVIEPLAIVWHAIKISGIPVDDFKNKSVLVLGGGPIGYALLLLLKAIGATNVIVSEPTDTRRRQVAEFASTILNPIKDDVQKGCKDVTNGEGVDIVFDCAGVQVALDAGFEAIGMEGTYVMVAVWEKPMVVPCLEFLRKHVTFKGTFVIGDGEQSLQSCAPHMTYTDDPIGEVAEVIQMMADGKLKGYEKMVTARITIDDIVEKGFEQLVQHKDDHIKIMVTPKQISVS